MTNEEIKPTLASLTRQWRITPRQLATAADIGLACVEEMRADRPMKRKDAARILRGFNNLAKTDYTLDDISVKLH